jgi:hypothetical protein
MTIDRKHASLAARSFYETRQVQTKYAVHSTTPRVDSCGILAASIVGDTPEEENRLEIRAGIFKESMGARNPGGRGLSYRPARLHRLAEFIP